MLLYEYKVRDQFDQVRQLANAVRDKFRDDPKANDFLASLQILENASKNLISMLPESLNKGDLLRHIGWIRHWLKMNSPSACQSDVDDICDLDIPNLEKAFFQWCGRQEHYDLELKEAIANLLIERHFDSAVRKAFVLLKTRLVNVFNLDEKLDGRDLVNAIFGKNGLLSGGIDEPERESMRNLLDGMYGAFRNIYGHSDTKPDWYEVDAILSMVNWTLKKVSAYQLRK